MGGGLGAAVQRGISAITGGSGNINIELTGGTINFGGFAPYGVFSSASAGNINTTMDGGSTITGSSANAVGINATASTGPINVTMNAGSLMTVSGASSMGINAQSSGAITVAVNGTIDPPDTGANVAGGGAGVSIPVGANGNIFANDIGIHATNTGTGAIDIATLAGSIICQGGGGAPCGGAAINTNVANPVGGVVTNASAGTTSINVGGTVYAFGTNGGTPADAIHATSTSGSINITTGAGVPVAEVPFRA
jgi:hypothetical protein